MDPVQNSNSLLNNNNVSSEIANNNSPVRENYEMSTSLFARIKNAFKTLTAKSSREKDVQQVQEPKQNGPSARRDQSIVLYLLKSESKDFYDIYKALDIELGAKKENSPDALELLNAYLAHLEHNNPLYKGLDLKDPLQKGLEIALECRNDLSKLPNLVNQIPEGQRTDVIKFLFQGEKSPFYLDQLKDEQISALTKGIDGIQNEMCCPELQCLGIALECRNDLSKLPNLVNKIPEGQRTDVIKFLFQGEKSPFYLDQLKEGQISALTKGIDGIQNEMCCPELKVLKIALERKDDLSKLPSLVNEISKEQRADVIGFLFKDKESPFYLDKLTKNQKESLTSAINDPKIHIELKALRVALKVSLGNYGEALQEANDMLEKITPNVLKNGNPDINNERVQYFGERCKRILDAFNGCFPNSTEGIDIFQAFQRPALAFKEYQGNLTKGREEIAKRNAQEFFTVVKNQRMFLNALCEVHKARSGDTTRVNEQLKALGANDIGSIFNQKNLDDLLIVKYLLNNPTCDLKDPKTKNEIFMNVITQAVGSEAKDWDMAKFLERLEYNIPNACKEIRDLLGLRIFTPGEIKECVKIFVDDTTASSLNETSFAMQVNKGINLNLEFSVSLIEKFKNKSRDLGKVMGAQNAIKDINSLANEMKHERLFSQKHITSVMEIFIENKNIKSLKEAYTKFKETQATTSAVIPSSPSVTAEKSTGVNVSETPQPQHNDKEEPTVATNQNPGEPPTTVGNPPPSPSSQAPTPPEASVEGQPSPANAAPTTPTGQTEPTPAATPADDSNKKSTSVITPSPILVTLGDLPPPPENLSPLPSSQALTPSVNKGNVLPPTTST